MSPECQSTSEDLINREYIRPKDSRTGRLIAMLVMVFFYMLAELIVGIVGNSLTLVGDAFHMLSDLLSLIIGLISLVLGRKQASAHATFGYKRSETIGGFFNASFLLSTAFFLVTEAIQKLITAEGVDLNHIDLVLGVAIGGLVINIAGVFIFHEHGDGKKCMHTHHHSSAHSHSHTHDTSSQDHHESDHPDHLERDPEGSHDSRVPASTIQVVGTTLTPESTALVLSNAQKRRRRYRGTKKQKNIAMHGVFLHVLGDLMGSVVAIVSALVQKFVTHPLARLVDPMTTMLMVIIIVCAAVPLLKSTIRILLQAIPEGLSLDVLRERVLDVDGVLGVHDLHVWTFTDETVIGHCHVVVCNPPGAIDRTRHCQIMKDVKSVFHSLEIHNITIEIEHVTLDEGIASNVCFSSYGCLSQQKRCCKYSVKIVS
ncbi:Zinc transporter protein [Giardia lamblia P15]|uniref:Zinc transporter protein n=1 Tax=Giardia intestinalis (strain P15) TaxID=658858 RepID=E1F329_GIAIA|nr:Zinc transporter protein [Giardia lamblia P15]